MSLISLRRRRGGMWERSVQIPMTKIVYYAYIVQSFIINFVEVHVE